MYKQVVVVRKDINMSTGKMAAQVAHASLRSWQKADKTVRERWDREGAKKIIVYANNLKDMEVLERHAKKAKVSAVMIKDAGHTELEPGTITCLGLGPAEEDKLKKLTSSFALV